MNIMSSFFCFLFGTCSQSSDNYGITDRYISVDNNTPGAESCYKSPRCDETAKYRTPDGTCNNLANPTWGSINTTYIRLLPASYNDGLHEIRKAADGNNLPNVRQVSRTLFPDVNLPDKFRSLAVVQWGQVVTHDSAQTLSSFTECCPNGQIPPTPIPECYPIHVPTDDPFYSRYNVTCMDYNRLYTTTDQQNCPLKPQQQFSSVTQWLDLSLIYGNSETESKSVRKLTGGKLKSEIVNGEITFPVSHEPQDLCTILSRNQSCLNAGDIRVNQNPDIAAISVILMKEHNRLADELSKLNPNWDDEILYQEARRINIAQTQHITYYEYLQHILASQYIKGLGIGALKSGYTKYDSTIRGGTINEFTSSVSRTFHSTIQGELKLIGGENGKCPFKSVKLGDYWSTSGDLAINCFEQLAKGLIEQESRQYHNYFTVQQTEFLNRISYGVMKPYGDDLESIDLMRARDAGVPSYNQFRKICGLSTFTTFKQLETAINPQVVAKLSKLYNNVEDIDLFVGVLFENPVSAGLTGPTGQCVTAQQFARWKHGDRFYFEHGNQVGSFTTDQLNAIRQVTLSSLMCRNTKMEKIQRKGFERASGTNAAVPCRMIPSINLSSWKDK